MAKDNEKKTWQQVRQLDYLPYTLTDTDLHGYTENVRRCVRDGFDVNVNPLWANVQARPEINLDLYRRRIRKKYGLPSHTKMQVTRLSRLERSLSQSNAGLRQQLVHLTEALDRSDEQYANEAATRVALDEKFSRLLKSLPVGVVEIDSAGKVKMTNPAADYILGRTVIGHTWFDVVREVFKPQADDGYEISTVTGRRVSVQTQSLDDRAGQLVLLHDQTDTRKLQAQLAHSDRLVALGRTAATLAHQVRTPVCGALLYLSQAAQDPTLSNETGHRIQKAMGRLAHLERQVKQILMLARGEVPKEDQVTFGELIQEISDALAPIGEQSAATISLSTSVDVSQKLKINLEALVGCVVNLVDNAVAVCDLQGEVVVALAKRCERNEAYCVIRVEDNGPGMSAVALKQAMEPFFTSRADGTGLGLSMVKMVVESHGGQVEIQSQEGAGTCVSLTLPI